MISHLLSVALSVVLSVSFIAGYDVLSKNDVADYTQLRDATWQINVGDLGHCSGTFIKPQIMLTAAHCGPEGVNLTVDGHTAVVLKKNEKLDLMLLFVPMESSYVPVGTPEDVYLDEKAVVVGYPLNMPEFTTEGRIQGLTDLDGDPRMAVSAPVIFGNSGGGVFTKENGRWVLSGVVSAVGGTFFGPVSHLMYSADPVHIVEFVKSQAPMER